MPSAKQLAKKRGREVAQQKEAKEKSEGRVCSGVPAPGGRSCAMDNRKNRNKKDKSGGRWS